MSQTTNDPIITSGFQPTAGIISPFQRFFRKLVSGSYPLFVAAILAMIWANIAASSYHSLDEAATRQKKNIKIVYTPLSVQFRAHIIKEYTMDQEETNRFNELYQRHLRLLKLQG